MTKRTRWIAAVGTLLAVRTAHAQPWTTSVVDTGGVGEHTSVAFGADGLALISYYDVTNHDLKVAHCLDAACSASTKITVDSVGDVGLDTSIAIGADGLGIVSYVDFTNGRLKVAHCTDAACSSATAAALTAVGPAGQGTDVAVGVDGRPIIAFRSGSVLRVAHCVDATCSDATATSYPNGGGYPTITIRGNGLPLIAHYGTAGLQVGRCQDVPCTSATFLSVIGPIVDPDGGGGGGPTQYSHLGPSLTTGADGRAVMAHVRVTNPMPPFLPFTDVLINRCVDMACTSLGPAKAFPVAPGPLSFAPAVAVGANDLPILAWGLANLQTVFCSGPACAAAVLTSHTEGREFPAVAMSPADRPLVVFHDSTGGRLLAAYYGAPFSADLAVTVQDTPDPVAPRQVLTYRVDVQNLGPNAAMDGVASVMVPPGLTPRLIPPACTYAPGPHTLTCPLGMVSGGPASTIATFEMAVPIGLHGPLVGAASLTSSTADPNPSNDSTTVSTQTTPGLAVAPLTVIEGSSGLTTARFEVRLLDDGGGVPAPVAVHYATGGGTATPADDYLFTSGDLTFTSPSTRTVDVQVVGDGKPEPYETFLLELSPVGAAVASNPAAFIVDDDAAVPAAGEIGHGTSLSADLASTGAPGSPADTYRMVMPPLSSFEVVVDGASGDIAPFGLLQLSPNGVVMQTAEPSAPGGSASLRFENPTTLPVANTLVQVRSGSCTTDCGLDDVYRLRAYETTGRIPRFNNGGGQTTILVLHNPSAQAVTTRVHYWSADGERVASSSITLAPRATSVTSTADVAPGQAGSITVSHGAPHGVLRGKAVAIEPSTGFSFDSMLDYRPR